MFQSLLVPLDGSERAEHALAVAARLARSTGCSVLLVKVVSPPIDYSGGMSPAPLLTDQVIESEMDQTTEYLKKVASSQVLAGIGTKTEVLFGETMQAILNVVNAYGVDLMLMVSHGRTGLEPWALGSVAYRLVHHIPVPLLVLREGQYVNTLTQTSADHPPAVLVSLDGSLLAEAALLPAANFISALAAPRQGVLHLAQIVPPFPQTPEKEGVSELNQEMLQRAKTYLAKVKERLEGSLPDPRPVITCSVAVDADVASALIHLAEHGESSEGVGSSEVIAMSTHGRGGLERLIMSSVTHRVLETTKLPMLVIKPVQLPTGLA